MNDVASGAAQPRSNRRAHNASALNPKSQQPQAEELTQSSNQPSGNKKKRPLKLTESQRERKRAIDREAQRSIRQKTKNYIAHLENLVRIMEGGGSSAPTG